MSAGWPNALRDRALLRPETARVQSVTRLRRTAETFNLTPAQAALFATVVAVSVTSFSSAICQFAQFIGRVSRCEGDKVVKSDKVVEDRKVVRLRELLGVQRVPLRLPTR